MKILISQTASLGDVILSTPVISAIKHNFPDAELWFLSGTAGVEILKNDSRLSGLISYDKKGRDAGISGLLRKAREIRSHKFNLVYAIQRSARVSILLALSGIPERTGFSSSALPFLFTRTVTRCRDRHEVERNLSILSEKIPASGFDRDLKLFLSENASISSELSEKLSPHFKSYAAIFPGSLWYTKRWSAENFSELALRLKQAGMKVYFFGSSAEKELVDSCATKSGAISFAGKTSLEELLYVVANCRVLVCNDSSALHIAAAFKIPTAAIFCATSPELGFGPWGNPSCEILGEKDLWCRPCSRHGGTFCPTGSEVCMKGLDDSKGAGVGAVAAAVTRLWQRSVEG